MTRLALCVLLLTCFVVAGKAQATADTEVALSAAPLPSQVRKDIVAAIAKGFADQPKEFATGREIALSSWVSFPPLARTHNTAIMVTAGSDDPDNGATGNRDVWLFRRVGNRAVLIMKGGGFGYTPKGKTYHNGMRDFQTAWNMSCCSGGIEVYRFNGTRYKPAYCLSYTSDDEGNMKFGPRGSCND